MKAIFFMFLLCCICCLSCSDEQNTLSEEQNVIENKTFEKVSSLELKQQLLDYLNNSVKTRTTFNNAEMNYDLGMQEILRPQIQTFGEEMIVVRSKMDANNIMAFYKENGVIENCLIIECAQNAEDALEETMFTCYDSNNIPIFKAMVNKRNNTCNVLEIYDGPDSPWWKLGVQCISWLGWCFMVNRFWNGYGWCGICCGGWLVCVTNLAM